MTVVRHSWQILVCSECGEMDTDEAVCGFCESSEGVTLIEVVPASRLQEAEPRCQHCPCAADERSFMCEDCMGKADEEAQTDRDRLQEATERIVELETLVVAARHGIEQTYKAIFDAACSLMNLEDQEVAHAAAVPIDMAYEVVESEEQNALYEALYRATIPHPFPRIWEERRQRIAEIIATFTAKSDPSSGGQRPSADPLTEGPLSQDGRPVPDVPRGEAQPQSDATGERTA